MEMAYLGEDEPRFLQEAVKRIKMEVGRIVEERLKKQIVKEMLRDYFNKRGCEVIVDRDGNLIGKGTNDPALEKILAIMVEGLANQIKFKYE